MNNTGEKDENRPDEGQSVPTASSGPGMVGIGELIGRYQATYASARWSTGLWNPLIDIGLKEGGRSLASVA